jgi:hypothetical protein
VRAEMAIRVNEEISEAFIPESGVKTPW